MRSLDVFFLCSRTSLISFAGVYGALPEFDRVFVAQRGWLSSGQLTESYLIGQIAPGPNMVLAVMVGYRVAGLSGALAAFVGSYGPPAVVVTLVADLYARCRDSPRARQFEIALRPLVLGLMVSGAATILRDQATGHSAFATAVVSLAFAALYARRRFAPLVLLPSAGTLFWVATSALAHCGVP